MSSTLIPDPSSLEYENIHLKLVSTRNIPRTETPGYTLDGVEERREFTAPFWIARILLESGYARMSDEYVTSDEWTQIHFKERFNPAGPPTQLPKDFYPRVYISLLQATKDAEKDSAKVEQLNRLQAKYRDIIESRIGKITRLASSESTPQVGVLQSEEQKLYEDLQTLISSWRSGMRKLGGK